MPLVLIGQAHPEGYRDLCRRYADENVHFLDHLPAEELASAYAAAKVHVLPSWLETPGLSSLEAAAAGCTLVVSDRGLTREYFGDEAWYCDPRSFASIREAVLAAYAAPRAAALRARVRTEYTWERAAQKTLEGYQLALALHASLDSERRDARVAETTRRHAEWLAGLAADLRVDIVEMQQGRQELEDAYRTREGSFREVETWARSLEAACLAANEELAQLRSQARPTLRARVGRLLRALRIRS